MVNPRFIVLISFLAACGAILYFWIWPLWSDPNDGIGAFRRIRFEKQQELKRLEDEKERLGEIEKEFTELKDDLYGNKFASPLRRGGVELDTPDLYSLPRDPHLPELIVILESITASTGMGIGNLTFGAPVSGGDTGYSVLPIEMSVSGTYTDFKRFLDEITKELRILDVSRVSFTPSGEGVFTFSISIATYFKP